jgi:hypothetical protein
MFARLKTFCLHSLTIAWGYVLAVVGGVMSIADNIGDALGDPGLKDQISAAIGDTRIAGRVLLGISLVTILVRLRSLKRAS